MDALSQGYLYRGKWIVGAPPAPGECVSPVNALPGNWTPARFAFRRATELLGCACSKVVEVRFGPPQAQKVHRAIAARAPKEQRAFVALERRRAASEPSKVR